MRPFPPATPPDDDLTPAERAELDAMIPPMADPDPEAANPPSPDSALYRSVVRSTGRLSERTLDAMARQLATGLSPVTVAAYFGLPPKRVRYLLSRDDFARRVAHYGARIEAQAALNLSRLFLEADRVLDNVLSQAANPDAKYFMECAKLVWNQVLPTRSAAESRVEVRHTLDATTTVALADTLQTLLTTVPHRARVNPEHVTRGTAGVPTFTLPPLARTGTDGEGSSGD